MLEKMVDEEETPEAVFFRYAFSCTDELYELSLISKEVLEKVRGYIESGQVPNRDFLESTYPNGLARIEKLAKSLGRDKWDEFVIRKYFLEEHNKVIDKREGSYRIMTTTQRELCKVRIGVVKKVYMKEGKLLTYDVDYGDRVQTVIGKYFSDARVGDRISTHWNFAVEKIN